MAAATLGVETLTEPLAAIQLLLFSQPHPSPSASLSVYKQSGVVASTGEIGNPSMKAIASRGSEATDFISCVRG